jgi:hypothetical protein
MTALAARPSVRNPQLHACRNLNFSRTSNIEAYLGQLTGEVNATACVHCGQKSAGKWTQCVLVKGIISKAAVQTVITTMRALGAAYVSTFRAIYVS